MPRAIGRAPALLSPRGGVIARPKVQSRTLIGRAAIGRSRKAEAVLLPVVSTQAPRYSCDTYELQVLPPFQFFDHTGYKSAVGNYVIVYEVGKDEVVILYVRHGA